MALWIIHHWLLPVISAIVWFAMLWGMLGYWLAIGQPKYPWQDGKIALISDIGATKLQPLFIVGSCVMGVFFILSMAADRLLRHQSRLPRNQRMTERVLSYLAILGSVIGSAGIILVACFNTNLHPSLHRGFLLMFIVGVALSAIFATVEYRYIEKHYAETPSLHRRLKYSAIFKICIVTVEVGCAIAFGITLYTEVDGDRAAAILEWLISFLFTFYLLSFAVDLYPAAHAGKGEFALDGESPLREDGGNGNGMHEVGRMGSATAVGFGSDASGYGGRVEMQHYDQRGHPLGNQYNA